jgi:hypothetical protein
MKLVLEKAREQYVREICDLVNMAYRGEEGWTKETDFVGGERANFTEIPECRQADNQVPCRWHSRL